MRQTLYMPDSMAVETPYVTIPRYKNWKVKNNICKIFWTDLRTFIKVFNV